MLAGLSLGLLWLVFLVWTPSAARSDSICLLRRSTGISCPTCGMTRAAAHLARGEVAAASALHPLALPFLSQVLAGWCWWGVTVLCGRRLVLGRALAWLVGLNTAAFLALWIYRLAAGTLPP